MNKQEMHPSVEVMRRNAEKAESMLKLLANAHRLMLLCYLIKEERTVSQLIELVGLSQSSISQHLAKMRAQGLVGAHKRGQMVYYRITSPEVEAILSTLYLIYCKE